MKFVSRENTHQSGQKAASPCGPVVSLTILVFLAGSTTEAFSPLLHPHCTSSRVRTIGGGTCSRSSSSSSHALLFATAQDDSSKESSTAASEAVFVPPDEDNKDAEATSSSSSSENEISLETAESLGRGAAKAKRGKRKGGTSAAASSSSKRKAAAKLEPEVVFYEGPPAITETIAPTISILTVVGIIPAAAAWARQAWVRYKITTRRIRVTSGIGGNEMAEIVYPDVVEVRTAKRLFGDGDLVATLRDGAKFEMRNIPNFDATMEFILEQVDKDVADTYRAQTKGGD